MVGSSKILTVSYGTFSCTLEGFDDSFETMKAIAEYFRNLASDDRYFGAEPPTPDVEMLTRIAEREIARRVEAHETEGRIVLRADDGPGGALAGDSGDSVPGNPAAPGVEEAEPETGTDDTPGPASPPVSPPNAGSAQPRGAAGDDTVVDPARQNTVAAKLRRIRSVVARAPEPFVGAEFAQDGHAPGPLPHAQEAAPDAPGDRAAEAPDLPPGAPAQDDEAPGPDMQDPTAHATPAASQDSPPARPGRPEPGDADTFDNGPVVAGSAPDPAPDTDTDTAQGTGDAAGKPPGLAPDQPRAEAPVARGAADAPDISTPVPDLDAPDNAPQAQDDGFDTLEDPAPGNADSQYQDTLAQLMADALPDTPETALAAAPHAARVVRIKRNDLDMALNQGLIEDEEDEDEDDSAENLFHTGPDRAREWALSPEDEDDLQRELAAVEAELKRPSGDAPEAAGQVDAAGGDTAPPVDTPTPSGVPQDAAAPAPDDAAGQAPAGPRTLGTAAGDEDLSRIFEETDSQRAHPEASQRRNAIQHLRAAVAATRADRAAGTEVRRTADDSPYRADLATVVRPRRPQQPDERARHARPDDSRAAPLKLVAEQRVDPPRDPVRPRRVTSPDPRTEAGPAHDASFADFAEAVGAQDLPDLLEAAAAFLADEEGRAQFSRPMLMGKLQEVRQGAFTREDGLRAFGTLMRRGKLRKLQAGRFTVTDATDFRQSGARHAG